MKLNERFLQHWKGKRFAAGDHPLLLAVSGGLDSMVMCHLFREAGIPFVVAHCNFGLRGEESDGDEAAVVAWCATHKTACYTNRFQTAEVASETRKSIQETARDLRYAWFEVIRKEQGLAAIATAHHADDNAETMLINLCRGTGIAGLHGIPERNGNIIRPMLFATRNDIAGYAEEQGISYREDSSNGKDDYLRNAIRHHIMPLIVQYMPGAVERIGETSQRILEAEQFYRKALEKEKTRLLQQRGQDIYVPVNLLSKRTPLQTLCFELFRPYGFTAAQTISVMALLKSETGRYVDSHTHRIIRNRDFLVVTVLQADATGLILIEDIPQTIRTGDGRLRLTFTEKLHNLDEGPLTVYADASKLSFPLILRRWKEGDYFYPLGMGMKKKKLSRFLTDQKVPAHEKRSVWVLESGRRIVWVVGMRLDERFKVHPSSVQILKLEAAK